MKPYDPVPKPCEKHFKNIGAMMRESLGLPPPSVLHVDNGIPYGLSIHSHIVAIAGFLKHTAARSITMQVGSIVVEARRVAIIAIILLGITTVQAGSVRAGSKPAPIPPSYDTTGSFLTCQRIGNDFLIVIPAHYSDRYSAVLQLKNGPVDTAINLLDWPSTTGIIASWEAGHLRVVDPENYLTRHALWYTVKVWEAK